MNASSAKRYRASSFSDAHGTRENLRINMDAPTIQSKFLPKSNELGLVAVGFSGGQVCVRKRTTLHVDVDWMLTDNPHSANPASMLHPWL